MGAQVGFQMRALPVNLVTSQVVTRVLLFAGASPDLSLTGPRWGEAARDNDRCGGITARRATPAVVVAIC